MKKIVSLLFVLSFISLVCFSQKINFNKADFYEAMASDKTSLINSQLEQVAKSTLNDKEAYEGALLMKKAGIVAKAKEKISLFKAGRSKLESAIAKDNTNTEFNFLRLLIQENAPKIVKYSSNIKEDSKAILANYKSLSTIVQKAIQDYSKKSAALKNLPL